MLLFSDCTAQFRRFTSERNSFMKRFHKSVAFLLCLCLLLGAFAPMASAASAPSIVCTTDGMTLIDGTTENMIFTITRAYPSEKYVVNIYNASGISVAYSEGEVDQDTARVDLYLPLESSRLGLGVGKYTVKYYLSYYTDSQWKNTEVKTASFQVLKNTCGGNHRFGAAVTVQAPTCSRTGLGKVTCSACSHVSYVDLSPKHTYTDAADQKCNVCGWTRQAPTLINQGGVWKYYDDGFFTEATTLVQYNGRWYYVSKGLWDTGYTGLVQYKGVWYYVKDGRLDTTTTGLIKYNSSWWYVRGGKLDTGVNTLVKFNGEWWYVIGGKVASQITSLVSFNGGWYYIVKGKLAANTTTLVKHNGVWWYVKNGRLDNTATTLVSFNGSWWYVKNGRLDTTATKLVNYNGSWWYVQSGKLAAGTTTLVKHNGVWYYVRNGKVDFSYNGTFRFMYQDYTIVNGRVV